MAAHYDLNMTKGSSFNVRVVAQDSNNQAIDLTLWEVRGVAKFRFSSTTELIDLNPQKVPGHFTDGFIDINLTAAQTAPLPVIEGVYDLEIFDGNGFVKKLLIGYVRVHPEATA